MKNTSLIQTVTKTAAAIVLTAGAFGVHAQSADWQDQAISPVGNPIYFEDPRITTEARPVFMEHYLPRTFNFYNGGPGVALGGSVQVYALQLRYALTDRLAIIATKDGYIEFQPNHTLPHHYGFADLAAGLKYALIDDRDNQFILTPGFTVTLPTGSTEVFQGHGTGVENIFVSAEKGFDKFHLTGNLGAIIPNDFDHQTAQLHYSLQADYFLGQYFIPFLVANGYTVLSDGKNQGSQSLNAVPLNTEGYDLINFGSADAGGTTELTFGGGFRSKLTRNLDFGVAVEGGIVKPVGIFDSRVTVDFIWRFK